MTRKHRKYVKKLNNLTEKYGMRNSIWYVLFSPLLLGLLGCTAATPSVSALGGIAQPFFIVQNEVRVDTVAELGSVTLTARCYLNQTQFEVEFPDTVPPQAWSAVPSSPAAPFTAISNNCSSTQTLSLTLDLQAFADFASILGSSGAYRTIRFRDTNITGMNFTDEVRIIYSPFVLARERFIFGQGVNNTNCQGSYCLQGRVVNMDQSSTMTSGTYEMKGRVTWQ